MQWYIHKTTIVCFALASLLCEATAFANVNPVDPYTVVWNSPSVDSNGSMPLGNGDIGLNVWVEKDGDLLFYISKSDAWSGIGRLLKLGRLRLSMTPNPFNKNNVFQQVLDVRTGSIIIKADDVELRIFVDANAPVIRVESTSQREYEMQLSLESWRTQSRALEGAERHSAYGLTGSPAPVLVEPDTIVKGQKNRIVWFHRNASSIWQQSLQSQHMGHWVEEGNDPLLHRTFGGLVQGPGFESSSDTVLTSTVARLSHQVDIHILTAQAAEVNTWLTSISAQAESNHIDWNAHTAWWEKFWERSWLRVSASGKTQAGKEADNAFAVTQGFILQRFISACAGRGAYPQKFNGSLFTVDQEFNGQHFNADFRQWGGPYWFQNTRLMYWPMLVSGDTDMMRPLFSMFTSALPFAKNRTKTYFGHSGAFYPETMYFWGAYATDNYGWERPDSLPIGTTTNKYIRYHYDGMLELLALMIDYFNFTLDIKFAREQLLPLAQAVPDFFYLHYPPDAAGVMYIHPSQALETWQKAINPTPPIAGLKRVLQDLLSLPEGIADDVQIKRWKTIANSLPPLPLGKVRGHTAILPAAKILESASNSETPELYAIFPYRLFGVGKPDLNMARHTFASRAIKGHYGWRQDDMQAATLGLAEEAKTMLSERIANKHKGSRFPAFWGPNFDWIPDQDHGGNALMTLQAMMIQYEGRDIYLLPAWPQEWNAEFKLHAPYNTVIEGRVHEGKLENLKVTPESRISDLIIKKVYQ